MAQYNIEGDISGVNEKQLEFIRKIVSEQGFENSKVTLEPVGKAGDNYVANVKRIKIENENGITQMIAKVAPPSEFLRATMNFSVLFTNEHIMYTEFLPRLMQLQMEEGIREEDQLIFAKCYGSLKEAPNEIMILEDLTTLGFEMLNRFEPLSDDCVKSTLKNFAKLHAFSYVLKKRDPDTYDHFAKSLVNNWEAFAEAEQFLHHFKHLEDNAIMVLDDPEQKNVVRNKVGDCPLLAVKFSKLDASSKYSVIQQGDAWTNNIMFKFEEGELKESIMIDYQLSKQSNPCCDLLYMIFNCTDHETRSKHFYDWLDYYHAELDKTLSNYGLKANYVYPRDQLDADLRRYGKLMFSLSVVLTSVLTINSEEAKVFQETMQSGDEDKMLENMNVNSLHPESLMRFKNRLVGLISSFTEFGLI